MHICQRHILISIEIYCKWAFLSCLLFLTNQTFPDKSKVNLRIKCKVLPRVVHFEVVYSRKGRLWMQVVDTFNGDFQTCLNGSLDNSFASLMLCYCFRRMLHTKYLAAAGGNGRHVCSFNTFFISALFCDFYSQRCGMAQKFLHSLLFIRVTATVAVKRSSLANYFYFLGNMLHRKKACRCHSQKYLQ